MADVREYWVEVYGFMPIVIEAETVGKARYQGFKRFREADQNCTFHQFLTRSNVWPATSVSKSGNAGTKPDDGG